MKSILELSEGLGGYREALSSLNKGKNLISINGCSESQFVHFVMSLAKNYNQKIIITYNEKRAAEIADDIAFFEEKAYVYPAKDLIFYNADIHGNLLLKKRMEAVRSIVTGEKVTIVTTADALADTLMSLDRVKNSVLKFKSGDSINLDEVSKKLVQSGYEKVSQVENKGEFAVRGSILDVYSLDEIRPFRIDLWDDEIDIIKEFDVETQRTLNNIEEITICPATEYMFTHDELEKGKKKIKKELDSRIKELREEFKTEEAHRLKTTVGEFLELLNINAKGANKDAFVRYFTSDTASFMDYFEDDALVFIEEPTQTYERLTTVFEEWAESMKNRSAAGYILPGQSKGINPPDKVIEKLSERKNICFTALNQKLPVRKPQVKLNVEAKNTAPYNNDIETLIKDIEYYKKLKYRVLMLSGSTSRGERMAESLRERSINAYFSSEDKMPDAGEVMVAKGNLHRGFIYPDLKFVVISQNDILGQARKKKKRKRYDGEVIKDFGSLNIGDYVVHESYGIGVYKGVTKETVRGVEKDYIKIDYAGGSSLYVLASDLDVVMKYSGGEGVAPKLNKIGGREWTNTKKKVSSAVELVAADLIKLYAEREAAKGYAFSPDNNWQKEFEELFPYEETDDQVNAIDAVKKDMESDRTMDRLICGDVGYGKTEIAIRAAFKAALDGKQVVFLVPTTVLAQQHYNTFTERFKDFPVRVDMLSRFRTPKEIKQTVEDLKKGFVDIVIGTHRVLSSDVKFKDLGLLIIDEEQRFGVRHKEKIKKLKTNIDVMTLTATPIPRTLHMSMIGIRDMSVLAQPPVDRMPIQTFVTEYNKEMIREAVNRELARNGQVYYVYNRVNSIERITSEIQKLVPDANVAYAHGQMSERGLERVMYDFLAGDIDVLVSTTIIETGLDISNVNTMIIHDADKFGLSQLYQLKGRVGRSNRTSYAFLMYKRDKILTDVARKRLQAIRDFTELGAGFRIAKRDLEIRGAGNLLGSQQHGHMEAVGYDLYCKMLSRAVSMLKGEKIVEDFNTTIDLPVDAYIPDRYINSELAKINIYKKIAQIETIPEKEDIIDELIDRFGEEPFQVDNLLDVAILKAKAHRAYITDIRGTLNLVTITLFEKAKLRMEDYPTLWKKYNGKLTLKNESGVVKLVYNNGIAVKNGEEMLKLVDSITEDILDLCEE